MDYYQKYIKYRNKYLNLRNQITLNQHGGMNICDVVNKSLVDQNNGRIVLKMHAIDVVANNISFTHYHDDIKPNYTDTLPYYIDQPTKQLTFSFTEPTNLNHKYTFVLQFSAILGKIIAYKTRENIVSGNQIKSELFSISAEVNIPVTIFPPNSHDANAAFIFLLVRHPDNKLAFIQVKNTRTKLWMLPGGHLDVVKGTKENPYTGMKREFQEEVGDDLPVLDYSTHVDMDNKHKTRGFIGFTSQPVIYKNKYQIKHEETNAMMLFPLADLISGRLDNKTIRWSGTLFYLLPYIIKFINENNIK